MIGRATSPDGEPLRVALGGAVTLATCMGVGRFVYTPILPAMMTDLGQTAGEVGLIAAANYLGYLVGAAALSAPGVPGSRRAWLLGGLVASAATTLAAGFFSGFAPLILVRFLSGVASAVGFVYASSLALERINAAGRPGLSSVLFAGIGSGMVVSALVVSAVEHAGFDWRAMWVAAALLSFAALLLVLGLIPAQTATAASTAPPLQTPLTSGGSSAQPGGALLRMIAAYGLLGFGYIISATFMVAIVRADPATRAYDHWVWPLAGLAAVPAPALWSAVARHLNPYRTYALGSLVLASGILVGLAWSGPVGALYSALTLGGTFTALTAIGIVGARNLSRLDPRQVVAGMTAAFGVGQILGPLFAGLVVDRLGSFLVPSLVAAALLAGGAALTVTIRDPRSPRAP